MVEYFGISIAEKNIEIECLNRTVFRQCKDYLNNFVIPDIRIRIKSEELETEISKLPPIEECYEGVATTRYYGDAESILVYKRIAEEMLLYDTFLMHGAVVALSNCAYMFAAPSGVGKTTRLKKWMDTYPGSIIVNGDKPLIRISDSQAIACGTPWCGNEGWNTNTMVPLKAIFLLERADKGEADSVVEISLGKAFPTLLQQTYAPSNPDAMRKTIQLLKALKGKVKIYKFRSHPTTESVRLAYETARPR